MDRFYNGKLLRVGYTTGSCATAATKAALMMLLSNEIVETVQITVPTGQILSLDVLEISKGNGECSCAIKKDGGDDPDATNNLLIFSTVSFITCDESLAVQSNNNRKIIIEGGSGVGRVTLKGLDQSVGQSAINSVPRRMIESSVINVLNKTDSSLIPDGDIQIIISIPHGEVVAKRTFNSHLGIIGGLSILGTTGIVDPMSSKALIATFKSELSVFKEKSIEDFLLVLGNYGLDFAKDELNMEVKPYVMCSNYLGDTLDCAIENSMKNVLLIAHIGKLVKCAIGILNTHSRHGDGRIEAFIRSSLVCNASLSCLKEIDECVTTDAILEILVKYEIIEDVLENIKLKVLNTINKRCSKFINVEVICFTKVEFDRTNRACGSCESLDKNNKVLFYTEGAHSLMNLNN
jgi:cobalt-precorrin-5B (C1)-methyltransferase